MKRREAVKNQPWTDLALYAQQQMLWAEEKHPRDQGGQFTSGTGTAKKPKSLGERLGKKAGRASDKAKESARKIQETNAGLSDEPEKIADTIARQMGGLGNIKTMTGGYNFQHHPEGALSFRFKGSKKANYVKITLDSMDTYTIDFKKIGGADSKNPIKDVEELDRVYYDQLKKIFESTTGLYLSL